jgi:hypothetical protein
MRAVDLFLENPLSYWTFATSQGEFSIVERTSRGVDLFFGKQHVGFYRSAVEAAERLAAGDHPVLPCAPENGETLSVPLAVHNWKFNRK